MKLEVKKQSCKQAVETLLMVAGLNNLSLDLSSPRLIKGHTTKLFLGTDWSFRLGNQ